MGRKLSGSTGFVVYFCERMRDGIEEHAKCFDTQHQAISFINRAVSDFFASGNYEFRLFHLGEEIELEPVDVVEPQPDKVVRGFGVVTPKSEMDCT